MRGCLPGFKRAARETDHSRVRRPKAPPIIASVTFRLSSWRMIRPAPGTNRQLEWQSRVFEWCVNHQEVRHMRARNQQDEN
jgi:hypothetical protein